MIYYSVGDDQIWSILSFFIKYYGTMKHLKGYTTV